MQIEEFDYDLPEGLIAQQPLAERDASRMMVVSRQDGSFRDSCFRQLPGLVRPGDVVVVNNTRVFPARLAGRKFPTGAAVEVFLLREISKGIWESLTKPARRLREGDEIRFGDGALSGRVIETRSDGRRVIEFATLAGLDERIDELGEPPLPPYIRRPSGAGESDRIRYQTVFASRRGAVAAPTAGLHFTPQTLARIREAGADVAEITLHVGYGTFEPVRVQEVERHRVAPEYAEISDQAAGAVNNARGRVIAVGTTTTRALESAVDSGGRVRAFEGEVGLTIKPSYSFRAVDALVTNFHLPRSSLLLLVCAFAGRGLILAAYKHAVEEGYRFYSYGDCMMIL